MRHFLFFGLLACLVLAVLFAGTPLQDLLQFDRSAIIAGEWWRLLTAHITHLSLAHALLNLAALMLVAYVTDPKDRFQQQILMWLWLFTFVGIGLYIIAPSLQYYVGLSGALHGAILAAIVFSPFYPRRIRMLVVLVVIGKIIWEQSPFYDDMANAEMIGGRTETRAHLLGGIAGLIWVAAKLMWLKYERK